MSYKFKSIAVAATAAVVLATTGAHAETIRWLTWKTEAAGDAMAVNIEWFANEFNERAAGKHELQVMWGGSAASQREIPDAISAGVGQIGDIVLPYYMDKFVLNNAAGYFIPQPLGPVELSDLMGNLHRTHPQFEEEMARYNLKVVGFRPLESYGMLCTTPVRSLEDLKGKRIRSYGSAYPALINALGATPISTSTTEAYEALERGIIDCTPTGIMYARSFKYEEVAKYYTDFPLGSNYGQFVVMNLNFYNSLDDETKAIIDDLGAQNANHFAAQIDPIVSEILADWEASEDGVEYISVDQDIFADVLNDPAIQELRQSWIDRATDAGLPGEEIAKRFEF